MRGEGRGEGKLPVNQAYCLATLSGVELNKRKTLSFLSLGISLNPIESEAAI